MSADAAGEGGAIAGDGRTSLAPVVRVLLVLVLAAAALTSRVVVAGERAIAASTDALVAGDAVEAIVRAREAASWYAPGAPHVRVAYGRLLAIASEAERRKLRPTALEAYRAITTASASTRWAVAPHAADAELARRSIARLESTSERAPAVAAEPAERIERDHLASIAVSDAGHRGGAVALVVSQLALALGLGTVLRRGLDATGRFDVRRGALGAGLAVLGLVGYAIAIVAA